MIELRTPAEIEAMRPAGRFVAETLATLRDETKVGTNLLAIDRRAHELVRRAGAESCYIDYHPSFGASPFGKVICTSVNDAVLHGLPFDYAIRDGDLEEPGEHIGDEAPRRLHLLDLRMGPQLDHEAEPTGRAPPGACGPR
jgi:hypothetical protein